MSEKYSRGAAYIDGKYMPIDQARIPVLDWGFTHSDATYDVVHIWKGRFFRLNDYLDRFQRSCESIHLNPDLNRNEITDILMQCARLSGLKDAYVEMICTRGVPPPGVRDPRLCTNHRFIAFAIPFVWILSPDLQEQGANLVISDIPRIPPQSLDPRTKNFHWGDFTRSLFQAYNKGGDTTVLVDMEGNISEGPGFNVFCVKNGNVISPGDTVLEGITRQTVRELCESLDIPFSVTQVSPRMLRESDEIFLSSTAGGIMSVGRIDDEPLPDLSNGPVSKKLRDLYWRRHDEGRYSTRVDY